MGNKKQKRFESLKEFHIRIFNIENEKNIFNIKNKKKYKHKII